MQVIVLTLAGRKFTNELTTVMDPRQVFFARIHEILARGLKSSRDI